MHRHVTSRNQGTFSRYREDPGNEVARVPLFCSYQILTSSVIYYWTDARQHGIYLFINRVDLLMYLRGASTFSFSKGGNMSDKLGYIIRIVRNSVHHVAKRLRFVWNF